MSENKIFISWEGFSGNLLDYYRDRSNTLSILKEAIPKNVHLTIILTLRRQDEFLSSAYNQAINQRSFEKAKTFLITDYLPNLDWFNYIKEVKNVFPEAELSIIPYDQNILEKTSIIALVGMVLGSEFLQSKEAFLISNQGLSKEGAKLFERVWKKYGKISYTLTCYGVSFKGVQIKAC